MKKTIITIVIFTQALLIYGQSEEILKRALEGKRVEVLIEMPATSHGIDIYVDQPQQMDFEDYSDRIKDNGISLYPGDIVMITKIKKKSKHIEFQLAGGGYGTFGDDGGHVSAVNIPKSSREEELEEMLDDDKKLTNRSKLERELKDLRRERELDQNKADREADYQREIKQSRIQDKRKQGGSRFNIRFDYKVGREELTVARIEEALREYVSFTPESSPSSTTITTLGKSSPNQQLAKGLLMKEALDIIGMPSNLSTSIECGLEKTTCTFDKENQRIEAIFVEKVLVKYTVSSR